MAILVSGGAGYIGSHTCVELLEAGYDIVVADNFYNSCPKAVERVKQISGKDFRFYEADMTKAEDVEKVFAENPDIDSVIHFAAYKAVGESVAKPLEYYTDNLTSTLVLLAAMRKHGVHNFVFSSSATVYGDPASVPINESFPVGGATNPYGATKVMNEQILTDCCKADPELNVALLRYFNPIGAHKSGLIGEDPHGIPNNLVPYIRQRLPHPRRHRRAGLHPCGGPGPRPCGGHQEAGGEARPVHLQPGHRQGVQRAGRDSRLQQGLRPGTALCDRPSPPRRHCRVLGRPLQGQAGAGPDG